MVTYSLLAAELWPLSPPSSRTMTTYSLLAAVLWPPIPSQQPYNDHLFPPSSRTMNTWWVLWQCLHRANVTRVHWQRLSNRKPRPWDRHVSDSSVICKWSSFVLSSYRFKLRSKFTHVFISSIHPLWFTLLSSFHGWQLSNQNTFVNFSIDDNWQYVLLPKSFASNTQHLAVPGTSFCTVTCVFINCG